MLKKILIVLNLGFISTNCFGSFYQAKFLDLTTHNLNIENFNNKSEFKNRLSELNYLGENLIKVIEIKQLNERFEEIKSFKNLNISKVGGEGAGE